MSLKEKEEALIDTEGTQAKLAVTTFDLDIDDPKDNILHTAVQDVWHSLLQDCSRGSGVRRGDTRGVD